MKLVENGLVAIKATRKVAIVVAAVHVLLNIHKLTTSI